eukprot:gene40944-49944_t
MFLLQSQLVDHKALEIFEALDQDISETADYFQEKCGEITKDKLILLRDKREGNEGRTLLHNAARNGSLSGVLALLRAGHQAESFDSSISRVTPLMNAIQYQHIEIAVILLEAGASLMTQDVNGENALHYAARSGGLGMLRSIVTAANLSAKRNKECASVQNIKRKYPEDLAKNPRMVAILRHLRCSGQYVNVSAKALASGMY